MKRNCLTCGAEFTTAVNRVRRGYGLYCSRFCHSEFKRRKPPKPWQDRFWPKVDKSGPLWNGTQCWIWKGSINKQTGYGKFYFPRHGSASAYKVAFELEKGKVPNGLELDHLCRNRLCVNPDHLEPVTHQMNVLRGDSIAAGNAKKTHCRRGHEFNAENTYMQNGGRECRICRLLRQRERTAKCGGIKMHCNKHHAFTATCADCKRKIRQSESSLARPSDDFINNSFAAMDSIIDSPVTDTIADSTGFSSDSFSGGDFGGGGAGGDY